MIMPVRSHRSPESPYSLLLTTLLLSLSLSCLPCMSYKSSYSSMAASSIILVCFRFSFLTMMWSCKGNE